MTNFKSIIEYPRDGVLSKELARTDKTNVTLFSMAKGSEISEHTSTKEGVLLVLEGDGTFNLAGKDIGMKQGVFIHLKKGIVHALKARKNTSFILCLYEADRQLK